MRPGRVAGTGRPAAWRMVGRRSTVLTGAKWLAGSSGSLPVTVWFSVSPTSSVNEAPSTVGAMLPWLTYIARNCARKAVRRARLTATADIDRAGAGEGWPALDAGPLPEELLARADTVDRVHWALATLAPPHHV